MQLYPLSNAGPWSKDTSVKELTDFNVRTMCSSMGQGSKLHARVMRCINALQGATVHTGLNDTFAKEVMLSADDHMVGKFWSVLPKLTSMFMDNDHFRMSMQLRLALVQLPRGALCQLSRATDIDDKCLVEMTDPCIYPHVCQRDNVLTAR